MLKSRQKIETPTFIMVKIEHISSVREFYVTQVRPIFFSPHH